MTDTGRLSNNIALEILQEQITELEVEINELSEVVENCQKVTYEMINTCNKKKIQLRNLQAKKAEIEELDESYGSEKKDDFYVKSGVKIQENEEEISHVNAESKNPLVRMKHSALTEKIARLKEKRGKIDKKQRVLVSKKLASDLCKMNNNSRNEVIDDNKINFAEQREKEIEKYVENQVDASLPKKAFYSTAILVSHANSSLFTFWCSMLKTKNIVFYGTNKLPHYIAARVKAGAKFVSEAVENVFEVIRKK